MYASFANSNIEIEDNAVSCGSAITSVHTISWKDVFTVDNNSFNLSCLLMASSWSGSQWICMEPIPGIVGNTPLDRMPGHPTIPQWGNLELPSHVPAWFWGMEGNQRTQRKPSTHWDNMQNST